MDDHFLEHATICTCQKYQLVWISPSDGPSNRVRAPPASLFLSDDIFDVVASYLGIYDLHRLYLTGNSRMWHKIQRSSRQLEEPLCKSSHNLLPHTSITFDPLALLNGFQRLLSLSLPRVSFPYDVFTPSTSPLKCLPPTLTRLEFGSDRPAYTGVNFCDIDWHDSFPSLKQLRLAFKQADAHSKQQNDNWIKTLPPSIHTLTLINCASKSIDTLHRISRKVEVSIKDFDSSEEKDGSHSAGVSYALPLLKRLEITCELQKLDELAYPTTLTALVLTSPSKESELPRLTSEMDLIDPESDPNGPQLQLLHVYLSCGPEIDGPVSEESLSKLPNSLRVLAIDADVPPNMSIQSLRLLPRSLVSLDLACQPLSTEEISALPHKLKSIRLRQAFSGGEDMGSQLYRMGQLEKLEIGTGPPLELSRTPKALKELVLRPVAIDTRFLTSLGCHLIELLMCMRVQERDMDFTSLEALKVMHLQIVGEKTLSLAKLPPNLETLSISHDCSKVSVSYPSNVGKILPRSVRRCFLQFIQLPSFHEPPPPPRALPLAKTPFNALQDLHNFLSAIFQFANRPPLLTDEDAIRTVISEFPPLCLCSARFVRDGRVIPNNLVAHVVSAHVKANVTEPQ